ncbi:hypothetical protein [Synechococcus sp. M16CYN]|uniref:hypothetical protein n=1 Tax=Synechococcus sp. M16CYN TaxID=3103139 RepID=UPI003246FEEE
METYISDPFQKRERERVWDVRSINHPDNTPAKTVDAESLEPGGLAATAEDVPRKTSALTPQLQHVAQESDPCFIQRVLQKNNLVRLYRESLLEL